MKAVRHALATQDVLPELVGSIYEAALDATRWEAFLRKLSAAMGSPSSVIWSHDFTDRSVDVHGGSGVLASSHGFDAAAMDSFAKHYCQCNVWLEDPRLHQPGAVVNSSTLFADSRLPSTEWYGDWLRPQDLFYSCAAVVDKRDERSFNVTLLRSRKAGAYAKEELWLLNALMPHLQTAFALHRRLYRAQALLQASLAVLESLPLGMILLDEHAHVLHANTRAHTLVRNTGLLQLDGAGGLHALSAADDRWLQRSMHDCVKTGLGEALQAGHAMRLRGLAGQQLQILVAPLPRHSEPFGAQCSAAVMLSDPELVIPSLAAVLRSYYRLTFAEAALAQSLINGLTFQEYAEQQGLSIHTVRSQFKSAAIKVGVSRQADFVRAVLTGPALLRMDAAQHASLLN